MLTTFTTDQDTHREFKKACIDNNKRMGEVLTKLMELYTKNPKIVSSSKVKK